MPVPVQPRLPSRCVLLGSTLRGGQAKQTGPPFKQDSASTANAKWGLHHLKPYVDLPVELSSVKHVPSFSSAQACLTHAVEASFRVAEGKT